MLLKIYDSNSQKWDDISLKVKSKYSKNYCADVEPDPEYFIVAHERVSLEIVACAGLTFANNGRLFSEQYLNKNIEYILAEELGLIISRSEIVEVGSLISNSAQAGSLLVRKIPLLSQCLGAKYLLCTVTEQVRHIMQMHNIKFHAICKANPDRLGTDEQANWGSYYKNNPMTGFIVVDVKSQGLEALDMVFSIKDNLLDSLIRK